MPLVEQELLTLPEHLCSLPVFSGVHVTRSLVLYLSFCTFSFGHCVVCFSSIYGFWLPPLVSSNSSYYFLFVDDILCTCCDIKRVIDIYVLCILSFNSLIKVYICLIWIMAEQSTLCWFKITIVKVSIIVLLFFIWSLFHYCRFFSRDGNIFARPYNRKFMF